MPVRPPRYRSFLLATMSFLGITGAAAQTPPPPTPAIRDDDEIIITATRRDTTVQDAPINIAAVSGTQLEEQGLSDLAEAAAWVPGVHLVDGGGRTSDRIVVRGLNVDALNQTDSLGNSSGNVVSTYVGEVPIYIDLKLNDMDRVEFLLGPQGTLYGAGTLGGAIRYIPRKPSFSSDMMEVRADAYQYSQADSLSLSRGLTFNKAFTEHFAIRGSIDKLEDSGFIDYNYVVREPGVSNANIINPADPDYDLTPVKDANGEDTWSGRLAARWAPASWLDSTLTYYFQHTRSGGRTISNHSNQIPATEYVSALRVLEPNSRDNQLLAWENKVDLGFAELTSATGYSKYKERGKRDQSNLLITLEYSYEAFPAFTAFTREEQEENTFTQELRLVSKNEGPFNWIVGGFYSKFDENDFSKEFTPGFSQFNLDNGAPGVLRPDALEYYAPAYENREEKALFGELSYDITPKWTVTGGTRWYSYSVESAASADFPLLFTTIDPDGRGPNDVVIDYFVDHQEKSGFLYKFNTSYDFTDDFLTYFTVSEGFRIGGGNGVGLCPDPVPPSQSVCASPEEFSFAPDKTMNFELGAHTQWLDHRLTVNGSIYYIKWEDPQLSSATVVGASPITKNGKGAETKGFDISAEARVTDRLRLRGSYAYTKAQLTELAPSLVSTIPFPTPGAPPFFSTVFEDGQPGDRLPGSPEHQFNFFATYTIPLSSGLDWSFDYGLSSVGDVATRTGNRGGYAPLDGYTVQNASTTLKGDTWDVTLYANNLFDEYGETAQTGNSRFDAPFVTDADGRHVLLRGFYANPIAPRAVGVRFSKKFGQ